MHSKNKLFLVNIFVCALIGGCANLADIRQFSALSADATGYTQLTDDYVTAPSRMKAYSFVKGDEQFRADQDNTSKARAGQKVKLELYHKVLTDYMAALGGLAGADVTNYNTQIKSLTSAATAAGYLQSANAQAVNSIADVIAEGLTDAYRQRKLANIIERSDAPLQVILADMKTIVSTEFPSDLANEEQNFDDYYKHLIAVAGTKEPAAAQIANQMHDAESINLHSRDGVAEEYALVLERIAKAHALLYANRNDLANKETLTELRSYVGQIRGALQQARSFVK